jgi:hypothetical protein
VLQVHYAVAADMRITTDDEDQVTPDNDQVVLANQQDNASLAGTYIVQGNGNRNDRQIHVSIDQSSGLPGPPLFKCLLPAALPGFRCYADAVIAPDNSMQVSRNAGMGVFFIDTNQQTASMSKRTAIR